MIKYGCTGWLPNLFFCLLGLIASCILEAEPLRSIDVVGVGGGETYSQPLNENQPLPEGDFSLKAQVQLPLSEISYPVEQTKLSGTPKFTANEPLPNLLESDEIWVDYQAIQQGMSCPISLQIDARAVPFEYFGPESSVQPFSLRLHGESHLLRSIDIPLGKAKILPRDSAYLVKRYTAQADPDWRVVDDASRRVFMRLVQANLRDTENLELVLSKEVLFVNLRLSKVASGKPTDILVWDEIPKQIIDEGDKRLVRMNLKQILRQKMPEVLSSKNPLSLVELIVFTPKPKFLDSPNNTASSPPPTLIDLLRINYSADPWSGEDATGVELPVRHERLLGNRWRAHFDLSNLHATKKLKAIEYLRSYVASTNAAPCVAKILGTEAVVLEKRQVPTELLRLQNLASSWGGPFGLVKKDRYNEISEIELPHILAHVPFGVFAENQGISRVLASGKTQIWNGSGVQVTPLADTLGKVWMGTNGLHLTGKGGAVLLWKQAAVLPPHTYLFLHETSNPFVRNKERQVVLRFVDGTHVKRTYFSGEAIPLDSFTGRNLRGVELVLQLPEEPDSLTFEELVLFSIKARAASAVMKEEQPVWAWQPSTSIWVQMPSVGGRTSWSASQKLSGKVGELAALRIHHNLSQRAQQSCWLEVSIVGASHTANRKICPSGQAGETVLSMQYLLQQGFESGEPLRQLNWKVSDDALMPNTFGWLQVEYAFLNTLPVSKRLLAAYTVELEGQDVPPEIPEEEFWLDLASLGQAWLKYGDVHLQAADAHPMLENSVSTLGVVTEWKFIHKGALDSKLTTWSESSFKASLPPSPNERWLKLGLFSLLIFWAVILWRRGTLQSGLVDFWVSMKKFTQQLSFVLAYVAEGMWEFTQAQRQMLNLMFIATGWIVGLECLGSSFDETSIFYVLLALFLFSIFGALHAWRWKLKESTNEGKGGIYYWIVGNGTWPPMAIWMIVVVSILVLSVPILSNFLNTFGINGARILVSSMGVTELLLFAVGGVLSTTFLLIKAAPVGLAVLYGLSPWIGKLLHSSATVNMPTVRWFVLVVVLYGLGLEHIGEHGENYFFTFGALTVAVLLHAWILSMRQQIEKRWPNVAEQIYGGAGSAFFSGALIGLLITIILLISRLELIAEQVAVVVYFCLAAGTVLEIVALRRAQHVHSETTPHNQSERIV